MSGGHHVIGVGSPLVDLLCHIEEEKLSLISGEKGGMNLVELEVIQEAINRLESEIILNSGGAAANTIFGLAQLGMPCSFLGKLGDDELAKDFSNQFLSAGINTETFKFCSEAKTGRCLSLITPDAERTLQTYLGAAMNLHPDEISEKDFKGATHAYVEGYLLFNRDLIEKVLKSAKRAGCTISLGLASFEVVRANRLLLSELLDQYVDVVFGNDLEVAEYGESENPLDGLQRLSEKCSVAAVTMGENGAVVREGKDQFEIFVEKVKPLDSTGAGDLWAAGFLYGHLNNWDLKRSGKVASLLGSSVVKVQGAKLPHSCWDRVKQTINSGS